MVYGKKKPQPKPKPAEGEAQLATAAGDVAAAGAQAEAAVSTDAAQAQAEEAKAQAQQAEEESSQQEAQVGTHVLYRTLSARKMQGEKAVQRDWLHVLLSMVQTASLEPLLLHSPACVQCDLDAVLTLASLVPF